MRVHRSAAWDFFQSVVLVAHPPGRLEASVFAAFHRELCARTDILGLVVLAGDAPPSPAERTEAQQFFASRPHARGAVLTDSLLARGAVTALSWFGAPVRAYAPQQTSEAFEFVRLALPHRAEARSVLLRLRDAVGSRVQLAPPSSLAL